MKKSRPPKAPEPRSRATSERRVRSRGERTTITANRVTLLPGFLRSERVRRPPPPPPPPAVASSQTAPRSRSVFREIEERYARAVERGANRDFAARVLAGLGPRFAPRPAAHYKGEIAREVATVNDALAAGPRPEMNRKRPFLEEEKENFPIKFPHVPPAKWVFHTPPNRKLDYGRMRGDEGAAIRPAVLDGKVVYEVKGNLDVDLSRCSNRQEVDLDKRFLVASSAEDFTFQIPEDEEDEEEEEEDEEEKFRFQADPYELENHFLSLTCRPKKAPSTVSRIASGLKRKRDIFDPEPGCSTDLETINEFDSNFTFINNNLNSLEESFTFKFTANDGATTGHLFDFDGNKKNTFNFRF